MFPNETDSDEDLVWDDFGCPVRLDLPHLADSYGMGTLSTVLFALCCALSCEQRSR